MRRTNLIALGVVLLLGIAVGAYYRDELVVWLYNLHLIPAPFVAPAAPVVSPAINTGTTLEMTGLDKPLPLVYSNTLDEAQLQEDLKQGAVILPLGTDFGEPGNMVITAHSSGTAAFGPFRFAFSKLADLQTGDTFVIKTPHKTYTYKVFSREIVWPTDVDKLPHDDRST